MTQPIERPQALTVLLDLTDYLLCDERTAPFTQRGLWHLDPETPNIRLITHVYCQDPHAVLDLLQADFGGEFVPDGDAIEAGNMWHRLTTTWQGVELVFILAAPPRYDLAAGRLDEQRHQVEDPAVPALAVAEPVSLPSAAAGVSA